MSDAAPPTRMTVVTPLAHERSRLLRHVTERDVRIMCCGPGPAGIERLARHDALANPVGPVILAGLAGAITRRCAVGSAHWVGSVVSEGGTTFTPPLASPGVARETDLLPQVTSTRASLTDPREKCALVERCPADLVDLESEPFALLAESRGWEWGIVRGVSDGPDDALPPEVDAWINASGHIRIARVARALLVHPALCSSLRRLERNAADALSGVANRLLEALRRAE